MRLLAATAGDAAQGRETEAEEIVGRSFVGGTIGFVVFTALLFGLATQEQRQYEHMKKKAQKNGRCGTRAKGGRRTVTKQHRKKGHRKKGHRKVR